QHWFGATKVAERNGREVGWRRCKNRPRSVVAMPNPTLKELARRVDQLEQKVLRLRQGLGLFCVPEGNASDPVDLDAALDRFFESAGIQGKLSGLAQLRAL